MENIDEIIRVTVESFDFAFCIVVNVLTYILNTLIADIRKKAISKWTKRAVLLVCVVGVSLVWYFTKQDVKLIINSAILAPVFWSWICKPLCSRFNIDYKKDEQE